jgi:hypothetical protein
MTLWSVQERLEALVSQVVWVQGRREELVFEMACAQGRRELVSEVACVQVSQLQMAGLVGARVARRARVGAETRYPRCCDFKPSRKRTYDDDGMELHWHKPHQNLVELVALRVYTADLELQQTTIVVNATK